MSSIDDQSTGSRRFGKTESAWTDESRGISYGARTLVLLPYLKSAQAKDLLARDPEARMDEAVGLAEAIQLSITGTQVAPLPRLTPATYLGKGKVQEIADRVEAEEIELVVVDTDLSPVQQQNLERAFKAKVIDRTGLILEIFGERAETKEGVLQVELAHLEYQKGRLVRSWTHLERQRGSLGFIGGPGETQIESDRRMIRDRIAKIRRQLDQVRKTRTLHRGGRSKVPYPVVALVGYTNAGKSTLFNTLTNENILAKDMLFATLDPTMRSIELKAGRKAILSDTVGFISHLPTHLIAAFRATLEEVIQADLILHVRDISHGDTDAQKRDVEEIMTSLGVDPGKTPIIDVLNKADLLSDAEKTELGERTVRGGEEILISAVTGEGLDHLMSRVGDILGEKDHMRDVTLGAHEGAAIAWLYANAEVVDRTDDGSEVRLTVRFRPGGVERLARMRAKS